jgi:hypothetical protein
MQKQRNRVLEAGADLDCARGAVIERRRLRWPITSDCAIEGEPDDRASRRESRQDVNVMAVEATLPDALSAAELVRRPSSRLGRTTRRVGRVARMCAVAVAATLLLRQRC